MHYLYLAGLVSGVALLQTTPYNPFVWNGVKPDFFLLLIIYLNLFVPASFSAWSGFSGGLLEDLLSGGPLGSATLSKTLSGYGVSLLGNKVVLDNPLVQALLVLIVSLLEASLRFSVLNFFAAVQLGVGAFPGVILSQVLLTTLLAQPFFWLLRQGQQRWVPSL